MPKRARAVWSALRTLLVAEPSDLVSFRSAAYAALSSAGGPGARNCEFEVIEKGLPR